MVQSDVRVTLDSVGRSFGRRTIFSGVTAEARSGESLVIAGPNGSGKSTLLRIITGLLSPTFGTANVIFDGCPLDSFARRSKIGYLAPDLVLYPRLSGAENLQFFASVRGIDMPIDSLRSLLETVGLKGRGRDFVGNYSSGMRQRLKYAFALLHQPPVLLLDEPTANLDIQGIEMAESIVKEQKNVGLVVIATNHPDEVGWGDRVVQLIGDP